MSFRKRTLSNIVIFMASIDTNDIDKLLRKIEESIIKQKKPKEDEASGANPSQDVKEPEAIEKQVSINEALQFQLDLTKNNKSLDHILSMNPKHDLKMIFIDYRFELRRISKEIIKEEMIRKMDSNKLRRILDRDYHKFFRNLQDDVLSLELKLEQFQNNYETILAPSEIEEIDRKIGFLQVTLEKLEQTSSDLETEARLRNMTYKTNEKCQEVHTSDIEWRFNGNIYPCHIHQFFEHLKTFFKENNIVPEKQGRYLRIFCQGRAFKIIDDNYPLMDNPPFEETRSLLFRHFGNKVKIMKQIKIEHQKIGLVPEDSGLGMYNQHTILQEHVKLIDMALIVRTPNSDPLETNQDEYTEELFYNLGPIQKLLFNQETRNMNTEEKFQVIVKVYKRLKEIAQIKGQMRINTVEEFTNDSDADEENNNESEGNEEDNTDIDTDEDNESETNSNQTPIMSDDESEDFENEMLEMLLDTSDQKKATIAKGEYRVEIQYVINNVRDNSCPLCQFFLHERDCKPSDIRHISPLDDTSTVFVESCIFIRNLSISERLGYLDFLDFCPICLQHSMSYCWKNQQRCMFASKQPKFLMCRDCPNRITTCVDHYENNKERLQDFKKRYAEIGLEINVQLD